MSIVIIIPARWGSTRFPGKPLAMIAGRTMLERVADVAREVDNTDIIITTEDKRIAAEAERIGIQCVMTSDQCVTGSDRVLEALKKTSRPYEFIVNLQGDAPFTPPRVLDALIKAWRNNKDIQVVTPVHQLSWADYDRLKRSKKTTPFSGTTVIVNKDGRALWFSKTMIPTIRKEDRSTPASPVFQHIGLYGYRRDTLERFCALPQSPYEKLEGLEQLRLLENDIPVHTVQVEIESGLIQSGIDSPEDVKRAEALLAARGVK